MSGSCNRCGAPLIQIDHRRDRLTGCVACNIWQGDKGSFVVEHVEDWEALGKVRESVRWTLRPRKNQPDRVERKTLEPSSSKPKTSQKP
jgi:hypothetical protein